MKLPSFARHRTTMVGLGVGAVVATATAATMAWALPVASTPIHACVARAGGAARIVGAGVACRSTERAVSWNATGPAGTRGVAGPAGPAGPAAGAAGPANAYGTPASLTCTAAKQGKLAGDQPDGTSAITQVTFDAQSPHDAATGLPTGKRVYKPLVVTKPVDAASPQYLQAMINNEDLTTCVVLFSRGATGIYRITLGHAGLAEDTLQKGDTRLASQGPFNEYEQLSFVFRTITVEHLASGHVAEDSLTPAA